MKEWTYRTYELTAYTAYAKGKKMTYPRSSTGRALKKLGIQEIVGQNGDVLSIKVGSE